MFYGEITDELKQVSEEYFEKYGYHPGGEISVSYGTANIDKYIKDIKECINKNMTIAELNRKRWEKYHDNNKR